MTIDKIHNEKMPSALRISSSIAFFGGIVLPILETIRRWHQMADPRYFIDWFDDYIIGALLLLGAWRTWKRYDNGHRLLIAAWGFATGMIFSSFFGQLQRMGQPDPAPVSPITVVVIKGIMFAICVVCLVFSLQHAAKKKPGHTMIL